MSNSPFSNGTHPLIKFAEGLPLGPSRAPDFMADFERETMEKSMPMFKNAIPGKTIETDKLRMLLTRYGQEVMTFAREKLAEAKKCNDLNKVTFDKFKAQTEALEVELRQARDDAKAAAEGRGIHENKRLTEMSAALEAKARALASTVEANRNLTHEVARLKNELTARAAVVTAYEREKNELTGAALITAGKMQTAAALLGEAKHDLDERYGDGIAPFLGSIKADIMKALGQLTTA